MNAVHNCSCCMTRRDCARLLGLTAFGAGVLGPVLKAAARAKPPAGPDDYVDAASLRPRPDVRIAAAFLEEPRPYWLGWPGTTYDLDARQKEYGALLEQSGKRLGLKAELAAAPLHDDAGLTAWLAKVKAGAPHGVLLMLQHMSRWGWVERVSREAGVPVVVFAPIGTAFTGHVDHAARLPGVHVVSSLEWPAVEAGLRMIRAKWLFEETRLLWIRGAERNETVMERLGTRVRAIPRDTFNKAFDTVPVTDEVRAVAADLRRHAKRVVEPTPVDLENSARVFVTAKRLLADEKANALSMDCLGMVSAKLMPTPPCGAWTLLQDHGVTAGCEADLFGAMSLMMTSYFLGRPGYMNDPVPETAKNLLIASHCVSATRLSGFDQPPAPYILRDHSESSLGVSVQVLWPVGEPVTLVRFTSPNDMLLDTGTVVSNVDTPPAGGCRTSVEIRMDNIEDCRDVKGFHQVVVLGNHRHDLQGFCELFGIRHTHSPEHSTFAERAS